MRLDGSETSETEGAREAQGQRGIEGKSRERPSQAGEAEYRGEEDETEERAVTAKNLTANVCLYSNPSVM